MLVNGRNVSAIDTIVTIYTSPSGGAGTIITAFTAANNSSTSVSYKAYIYNSVGDAVGAITPLKIVVRDRFDSAPSITNHVVPAGGTLRVENSAANGIDYYLTGREQ